jgi:hypothetical protein
MGVRSSMRVRRFQRVVATATVVAAVFMPSAPLAAMQPASAAATVSIAALAAANVGKGAGNCSTVNSLDNSLGGSQFNGSCTGYRGGAEYWCADFLKWVWQNAASGIINVAGLDASAASFYSYGSRNGTLHTFPSYQPQPGDAIVYDYDGQGHADHVGLVTSVSSDGTITTINGDWNGEPGYGMVKFAETSEVVVTTLQPNEVAVGSTPSSMGGMTISAYVTPVTTTAAAPASTCSPIALTKALAVANPQSISWKLKSYACASGWAVIQIYAPAVGNGTAFLQQTASGWNSDALGEVNCADIPGPLGTPLPPQALTVSLLSKAGICASGNINPTPTQQPPTQQGPAPFAVTSSSPTSGPASGGTLIVIHGSGFSSVTKVVMNSIEPPLPEGNPNYFLQNLHPRFSVVSDSEIEVTTTAGAAGFTYEIDFITPTNEYFRNTFPGIPLFTYK